MRISDWSSDVCSSDLRVHRLAGPPGADELRRQIERHRMAGVERTELVRGGKARDVDECERHRAMDIVAAVAVLALRQHAHARARAAVGDRKSTRMNSRH